MMDPLISNSPSDFGRSVGALSKENAKLRRYLQQIGSSSDTKQLRKTIMDHIHESKMKCRRMKQDLAEFDARGTDDYKMDKLRRQFEQEFDKFMQMLEDYANLERRHAARSVSERSPLNRGEGHSHEQQQQQQQEFRTQILPYDLDELEQREQRIQGINDELQDVKEMWTDLHGLVMDQQEDLDRIEAHVTSARENVEAGTGEVRQAADYQRAKRKKMCIIALVLVIVLAVLVVIIFTQINKNKKP